MDSVEEVSLVDSRGVEWLVRVTGPTRSGTLPEGGSIDDLPEIYFARYRRPEGQREFTVVLEVREESADALRTLLEDQPEWQYEEWMR